MLAEGNQIEYIVAPNWCFCVADSSYYFILHIKHTIVFWSCHEYQHPAVSSLCNSLPVFLQCIVANVDETMALAMLVSYTGAESNCGGTVLDVSW